MQIYRELGLYEEMYAESLKHYDEHAGLHIVETLAGTHLGTYMKDINDGIENISPTHRLFLTQQMFEPLLQQHAIGNGAVLRFSTELVDFQHDQEGVTALIRSVETGEKQIVRAKYMVACDGNRSPVREKLGIKSQGHGLLSHSLTIYFDADLGKFVKDKYNGVIYVENEHVRGFFRLDKTGREGFLVVNTAGKKGTEDSRHPSIGITDEKAGEMLRAAIGADVDFKITHLSPWNAECNVAEHFNDGKIILAGDAAHVVTPHGGFGGNTGIHDAHNLAWKLALVLKGKAGEELVTKTYHDERYPVSKKTVDQVFERFVGRAAPDLFADDAEVEEEVPEPHLELGYQYHSRALTTNKLVSVTSDPATAKARPGTMAHHVLIKTKDREDEAYPVADLLGSDFVLIAGHEGSAWLDAAKVAVKNDSTLPELKTHQLTQDNTAFYKKYDVTTAGCVLLRPDGFVAWSEAKCATSGWGAMGLPDAEHTIKCVLKQILCITPERSVTRASSMASADSAIALPKNNGTVISMATEVSKRERALKQENDDLQRQLRENEERLAQLREFSELQDKMAMLAMRLDLHTVGMDTNELSKLA